MERYDFLVLGAGSGGLASAKRAASYGARVGIIEGDRVGGTCVIRGCVPKKMMYYAAINGRLGRLAADFGWPAPEGDFDWNKLIGMRNGLVDRLETTHTRNLDKANVELIRGKGVLKDANTIEVEGKLYHADKILIAVGTAPVYPPIEGVELGVSSDGLFELDHIPSTAVVIGGGYIGVEFAGILQSLGCQVTLLVRNQLLAGFDRTIVEGLQEAMKLQGIDLHLQTSIERVEHVDDLYHVYTREADGPHEFTAETCLLFATGRKPRTANIGIKELGVELGNRGQIIVDADHNTSVDNIYAVGDVIELATLTPVAIKAGRALADRLFGGKENTTMSYENIPTAVFSQPPIGTVGMTEEEAVAAFGADGLDIYKANYAPLAYAGSPVERKVRTVLKMIVERATDKVVGLHMLGDDAPEIIQGFAVAIRMGATKADFDRTVAIHPTQAEEFVLMK